MGRCECFDCFIWPFMKQDCNIINKKVSGKVLWMSFGISTSAWNFCGLYPESSIYCRRDTGPPQLLFCGTCIPVQWTVSMVSDMQAMTSELSCSTELSSSCYTAGSANCLFYTWQYMYAYATSSQFIQPPFSLLFLLPHPHLFSMSVFSLPSLQM